MTDCRDYEPLIEKILAGEPFAERDDLLRHARGCPECGDLLEFHEWLAGSATGLDEPEASDLAEVRRRVLARIAETQRAPAPRREGRRARWAAWAWPHPALLGAAAAILLVGFIAGRLLAPAPPAEPFGTLPSPFGGPAAIQDLRSSPYLISNVTLKPVGAGIVALGFDVTKRVELSRPAGDPVVREGLVQAMIGSTSVGERLKAVSLAGGAIDPEVRRALIRATEADPSMAVRLQALVKLTQIEADGETQEAMLRVLRNEPNVQMRLLAVDYLGTSRADTEKVREALRVTQPDGSQAVLRRATERFGI